MPESKTMFNWEMDKNINDFRDIAMNLLAENQRSRGEAVLYLIERVKLAEDKLRYLKEKEEQDIASEEFNARYLGRSNS